jgi:hypothetical protein
MNGEQIMLVTCSKCRKQISSKVVACPNCGHPGPFAEIGKKAPPQETASAPDIRHSAAVAETQKRNKKSGMAWKAGAVVAALLCLSWAGWFFMSGANPDKPPLSLGQPHSEKLPLGELYFDGKYGYINGKGEIVIPPRSDEAESFDNNGLARVSENGKSGYIDLNGQFVLSESEVCKTKVLVNARNEVVWPQKTSAQICGERSRAEEAHHRNAYAHVKAARQSIGLHLRIRPTEAPHASGGAVTRRGEGSGQINQTRHAPGAPVAAVGEEARRVRVGAKIAAENPMDALRGQALAG